ncbi:DNA-binding SARP family transcriptional activator/Tfp pilus assembly protein PilF [Amycolatopsis endophytica]|uniref:DNA-binding SARP family transcriptional activator/Tfp pilus assembly protein PilF n=1 Tax=Amycolatopsis endophytica TaxID=860233 RepID=A0A853BFV7_9PSEU|nr:BTAD domain-containing putative transcriptional regulator [Amycolatopsis endophytica]NYI93406.1 DNA-binding SARP family transcriptional activator/Tfp pilus assembly protein PilF [Amycolatopsis endophytica]
MGTLVQGFRRRAGLTQREVADLAGLSVAGLRDVEQGRVTRPRVSTLRKLGDVLGLSRVELGELLREAGSEQTTGGGVRVEVLGPLRVLADGDLVDPGSEKQRTLLALLALSPNTPVGRDTLVDAIWGDQPEHGTVDLLQSRVSRLRRRLRADPESGSISSARGGYQLKVAEGQHDLLVFRRLVARARHVREEGELTEACGLFAEAVGLWRGEPLEGLSALESHPIVVALVREYRAVVVEYAGAASDLGRYQEVLPLLQRVAEADPLHEAVHARLMIALAGSGQQAAALDVFDTLRRRLAGELGADPGPELTTAYQRVLRQEVARPEFAPVSAHRQLPLDTADFSGREAELATLRQGLRAIDGGTAVGIALIEGMAGVGKTRLAVHVAHQLLAEGRYGDCQLYVDLHGHSDRPPADPAAVLASFLRLLGVPGEAIPPSLEERASLYRDRVYGRDVLVVLDNAASEDQILPLLPAGPTNLVLVTSRRALALDGARTLPLDVFTPAEARELLVRVVGAKRVEGEPEAARRVAELCGWLPMAVALAARRLQSRPTWTVADLAARLRETGDRLDELAAGSRRLRAVFELSYQALETEERRLFRLLGLHPGADFTPESVGALAGLNPARTRWLLDRLVDENLVTVVTRDRYRLHNLLAEYARGLARDSEPEPARRAAITRVLDFYLHTAARATHLIYPGKEVDLAGAAPVHGPVMPDREAAKRWLEAERPCLIAAVSLAAGQGWPTHAWQLTRCLRAYLYLYGYSHDHDWVHTHEAALSAATAARDEAGEAHTRSDLAAAYLHHGRAADARAQFLRAIDLHRARGERELEAASLNALGLLCHRAGEFPEALRLFRSALDTGDARLESAVAANLGATQAVLGRLDDAVDRYRHSLVVSRRAGDADGESGALADLGDAWRRLGRHREAIEHLRNAVELAESHGLPPRIAYARHRLGNTYRETGRFDDALTNLNESLRIVRAVSGPATESEVLIDFGAVHRDIGDLLTAADLVEAGLRVAINRGERYQQARALNELAELHRCAARAGLAQDYWRRAFALFDELGTPEAAELRDFTGEVWSASSVA